MQRQKIKLLRIAMVAGLFNIVRCMPQFSPVSPIDDKSPKFSPTDISPVGSPRTGALKLGQEASQGAVSSVPSQSFDTNRAIEPDGALKAEREKYIATLKESPAFKKIWQRAANQKIVDWNFNDRLRKAGIITEENILNKLADDVTFREAFSKYGLHYALAQDELLRGIKVPPYDSGLHSYFGDWWRDKVVLRAYRDPDLFARLRNAGIVTIELFAERMQEDKFFNEKCTHGGFDWALSHVTPVEKRNIFDPWVDHAKPEWTNRERLWRMAEVAFKGPPLIAAFLFFAGIAGGEKKRAREEEELRRLGLLRD